MYRAPKTGRSRATKLVFERSHDLDLFRCYGEKKMAAKLERLGEDS